MPCALWLYLYYSARQDAAWEAAAQIVVGHRTRTSRLLMNPQPSFDATSLTIQQLRIALEASFRIYLSESKPILSIALDLPNRLCATIALSEVDSLELTRDSFEPDLELDANVTSFAQVTIDTNFPRPPRSILELLIIMPLTFSRFQVSGTMSLVPKSAKSRENWL